MHPPVRPRRVCSRLFARRHGGLFLFHCVFGAMSLAVRIALLVKAAPVVAWDVSLLATFGWGVVFDLGAAAWFSLPLIVALTLLPAGAFERRWVRRSTLIASFLILSALLFNAVAEWVFWDEFGARFNFIAVDYLVYTSEVLGNIRESYPMPLIFGGILGVAALLTFAIHRSGYPAGWMTAAREPRRARFVAGAVWLTGATAVGMAVTTAWLPEFHNNYNRELALNGVWSFFSAFRNNELEYDRYYESLPVDETFARLRHELTEDGSILLRPDKHDTLRYVASDGTEQRPNIIQITVESLSAEFLGAFNPESTLTPHLDELISRSLLFDNFYATGTRTDRGMEALTLSLPPTPGRSIVKRPDNEDMFTLGSVLRTRDYDTAFIYGGLGYFDNMNAFFGGNGYRVIDRNSVTSDDVTFANVWGACDEDLFRWTMREADASAATGRPFHYFVMTTSNHRPYTFPEGRIDLPSKTSGRAGAVKYTDYAIGKFIRDAASKPWFRNTVFVIVADHCASSAGKTRVPVSNYHIPLIIHAPGGQIAPGRISTLTSQMDFAPTLLGLLNWSYPSRFFGHDVRKIDPEDAHALVGTYQMLGHLERGELVVLKPMRENAGYAVNSAAEQTETEASAYARLEAIGFYQTASYMYRNKLYRALSPDEFTRYSALGRAEAQSAQLVGGPGR